MKNLFLYFILLVLSGCASMESRSLQAIDQTQKTVYIQPGSMRVLEPIKRTFLTYGWDINEFDPTATRYRLQINSKSTQLFCLNEWSELELEIVLLDNKNRSTVFVVQGRSCDSYDNVVKELVMLID